MRETVIAAIIVCIVALAGNTFWVDSKTGRQRRATGASNARTDSPHSARRRPKIASRSAESDTNSA
jgi:hypothetical protein